MKKLYYLLSLLLSACMFSCADNAASPTGTGQGGSMARFAVTGDYLYVVDRQELHVYGLSDPSTPVKITNVPLGLDIETIFPYEQKLFIGSMTGMHIYDISTPDEPVHLSTYTHITSCDPVVVQGELAYVTLRDGSTCARGQNQLDIINISDPSNPYLVANYQMQNPFGLGIDGNTLFVCEGNHGLKVLNVENPQNIREIGEFTNLHAFDVIPSNNNLILTGNDGIYQFDYSQPENLRLNSSLSVTDCE